ncbi:MAG: cupin domain-containing protein [Candidatus Lokiarchaeota archaeon]|nr:cupin domain-containing protein [Candidatus Lokiarchaeota archaeon]
MTEKIELTEALELEKMLDYQEGSIVSRTLINKDVGTVTLFSFDQGEGLSEHTAPFDAIVYVFDGEAEIMISQNKHILTKGQMILMPGNEPHALKALKRFKMMLIMVKA